LIHVLIIFFTKYFQAKNNNLKVRISPFNPKLYYFIFYTNKIDEKKNFGQFFQTSYFGEKRLSLGIKKTRIWP